MLTGWILNAVGLFVTTVGALLMIIAQRQLPALIEKAQIPEGRAALEKHYKRLTIATVLLATWLVIQCLALILI